MTTKEEIRRVLEKWEFPILREIDNSIVFRYQMNYVQLSVMGDENNSAVAITLTGLFTVENEKERLIGLQVCNELNCNLLQAKLYFDSDSDLVISSEFFNPTPDDLEYLMKMSLQVIISAKKRFRQKYEELTDGRDLLSTSEQELN